MLDLPHILSAVINYVLVALLLLGPLVQTKPPPRSRLRFWVVSVVALTVATLLAEAGKHFTIWPGHRTFPSGHETFALAAATCLGAWDKRWLWAALPLAALLGWALVAAHWHQTSDVLGALLVGPPAAWLCLAVGLPLRRRPPRRSP